VSSLARWCFRRRRAVLAAWLVVFVALVAGTAAFGTAYNDSFQLPGTESSHAQNLLEKVAPRAAGESDTIAWRTATGSVRAPGTQARISAMLARVAKAPGIASVVSPYAKGGAARISPDGRTAYATVNFAGQGGDIKKADIRNVIKLAEAARTGNLEVELGGNAISGVGQSPASTSELVGIIAAAIILFFAFGSLGAMALPLIGAIVALGTGLLTIGLSSHVIPLANISPTLAALIGLGVGIDYALFIVTRHRSGLRTGMSVEDSAVRALDTSGRAVLFAGATVCVALLGLLVLRVSFLNGLGIGAAITVVFSVASAITLLPALLGFFGKRVLSRRERKKLAADGPVSEDVGGAWLGWARFVERHPRSLLAGALVVLVVLAIPVLSLRLGSSDEGNDPSSSTSRKAYDMLATGFGAGTNGPLLLVAEVHSAADRTAFTTLTTRLAKVAGVAGVARVPAPANSGIELATVIPTSSPQSEATSQLISRLRHTVIPRAELGTSLRVSVGGITAIFGDFATVLNGKLPLFIAVIILLGFLLLLLAFRSLAVPLTAALMNLAAAAASFGVVVAFFQWGWGSDALGLGGAGPVEAFLPVIMLSLLFGLSMDYQVFLVSRMHEEWTHTGDNRRAVTIGQASTGRVITAAATIMICVFIAFVFGGQRVIAEFGIGLAAAVLIDAFVIRTVLVPALMHIVGPANWWLPGRLDRILPHLSVEPDEAPTEPSPPSPAVRPVATALAEGADG
jgi:RND superfamily putative drug exporter